jgi:hypothetical protein
VGEFRWSRGVTAKVLPKFLPVGFADQLKPDRPVNEYFSRARNALSEAAIAVRNRFLTGR